MPDHTRRYPVKPDDHSEVVPLLPIPNRTVKRLSADDSAGSRVKVGHCQATIEKGLRRKTGAFCFLVFLMEILPPFKAAALLQPLDSRLAADGAGGSNL